METTDYVKPKTVRIHRKTWDEIPEGERPVEVYIIITGYSNGSSYAWSPDGYGCYYYETFAKMREDF